MKTVVLFLLVFNYELVFMYMRIISRPILV